MINILIRTHERPAMFNRCIDSILEQAFPGYPDKLAIYVTADTERSYQYAIKKLHGCGINHVVIKISNPKPRNTEWFYNLYCNDLLQLVDKGAWAFFLDDDDTLLLGTLQKVSDELWSADARGVKAVICQFLRGGKPKPSNVMMDKKQVRSGYIGLPAIFIHESAIKMNFTDAENADYLWIKQYEAEADFVKIPVVSSQRRNHGKPE